MCVRTMQRGRKSDDGDIGRIFFCVYRHLSADDAKFVLVKRVLRKSLFILYYALGGCTIIVFILLMRGKRSMSLYYLHAVFCGIVYFD